MNPEDIAILIVISFLAALVILLLILKRLNNKELKLLRFGRFSIEHGGEAVFWINKDSSIFYANDTACKRLGYTKQELCGKKVSFIAPDVDIDNWQEHWAKVKNAGTLVFNERHKTKDGLIVPVEITANHLEYGGKEYHCTFAHDITDRIAAEKETKKEQDFFSTVTNHSSDGIVVIGTDGTTKYVNKSLQELYGYSIQEASSMQKWADLVIPDPEFRASLIRDWTSAIETGTPSEKIFEVVTKSGKKIICRFNLMRASDDIVVINCQDFTQRMKTEKELLDQKERAQKYLDVSAVMFVVLNTDGTVAMINKKGCEILGYEKEEEVIGKNWLNNFLPEWERARIKPVFEALVNGKGEIHTTTENHILTKDGKEKLIAWHNTLIRDENGKIINTLSSGEDITDRRDFEDRIKDSEERYRSFVEDAHDIIQSNLPDGSFVFVNQAWSKTLGYSDAELLSLNLFDIISPDMQQAYRDMHDQIMSGKHISNFETAFAAKSGKIIYVEGNITPRYIDGEVVASHAIFRDITSQKRTENKLRENEFKLNAILHSINDQIIMVDKEMNITWANDSTKKLFKEDIVGKKCYEVYRKRSEPCTPQPCNTMRSFIDGKTHEHDMVCDYIEGQLKHYHCTSNVATRDEHGNITAVVEVMRDITEQKIAEEALKDSEANYRQIFNSANDAIILHDPLEHKILYCNDSMCNMFGYTHEELKTFKFNDIAIPSEKYSTEAAYKIFKKAFEEGPQIVEWICQHKTGKHLYVEDSVRRITIAGGKQCLLSVVRDITERKESEEKVRQSEYKLNAMLQSISDSITMMDKDLNIIWANETTKRWFGDDIIGRKCFDIYHKGANPCEPHPCAALQTLNDGNMREYDTEIKDKNGKTRYLHCVSNLAIRDDKGRPLAVVEIARDMTDHIIAKQNLLKEKNFTELVINNLPGTFYVMDNKGLLVRWNKSLEDITGYSFKEIQSMHASDFFKEDREKVIKAIKEGFETGETSVEAEIITKKGDGVSFYFTGHRETIDNNEFLIGVGIDISDRKKAETALSISESQYRATINAMKDSIHVIDSEYRILIINDSFLELNKKLGLPHENVAGMYLFDLFPFLSEKVRDEYQLVFEKGKILSTEESTKFNGYQFITETRKIPIYEGDKVTKVATIIRDITEAKKIEYAIKESEEKFRVLAEKSPNMIFINKKGKVIYANEKCVNVMGYTRDEFYSPDFDFLVLIAPEYRDLVKNNFRIHNLGEEIPQYEYDIMTKDGTRISSLISTRLIQYEGEYAILGIVTDISQRKQLENEIVLRNRELNAYNQIATIIGHSLDVTETLGKAFNKILELLEFSTGAIHFYDEATQLLTLHHNINLDPISIKMLEKVKYGEGVIGRAAKTLAPVISVKGASVSSDTSWLYNRNVIRTLVALPLQVHSRFIGVLSLGSLQTRNISESDIKILTSLGEQIALAIENSLLFLEKRKSEELYRSIFNITPVAIMTLNTDGTVATVSPYLSRVFGRGRVEDFVGKNNPFEKFTHNETPLKQLFAQLLEYGKAFEADGCEGRSITGQQLFINVKAIPLFDDKANVVGSVVVMENVTPRKKAEIAENEIRDFLESIIQQSPMAVSVFDKSGRALIANHSAITLFGVDSMDEFSSKFNFIENQYFKKLGLVASFSKAIAGETVKISPLDIDQKQITEHNSAKNIVLSMTLFPIFDSRKRVRHVVCMFEDITKKREMEQQIIQRNRELLAFNMVAKTLGRPLEKQYSSLEHALDILLEVIGFEIGTIYVKSESDESTMRLETCRGLSDDIIRQIEKTKIGQDLVGITAEKGEIYLVQDTEDDKRKESQMFASYGIRSFVCVPLKAQNMVFGVMQIGSLSLHQFTANELQLLLSIGNQIGVLLENMILYRRAQKKAEHESILNKILSAVQSTLDLDVILRTVVDELSNIMDAGRCCILQSIGNTEAMTLTHEALLEGRKTGIGFNLPINDAHIQRLLVDKNELLIADNVCNIPAKAIHKKLKTFSAYSFILAPIVSETKFNGAIMIIQDNYVRKWEPDEINLVRAVASQVAMAIKNARLYRKEKEAAIKLQGSLKSLMDTNKELESFMFALFNDLTPPIMSIESLVSSIKDNMAAKPNDKKITSYINEAEENLQQIKLLIASIEKLSKTSIIIEETTDINILDEIDKVINNNSEFSNKKIEVKKPDTPVHIKGDAEQFATVIFQLLDNSVRSVAKKRKPIIEIKYEDLVDKLEIHVIDNGIGIEEKYHDRIFDTFYKIDSKKRSGMGLAIVKRIVESVGGKVGVKSTPGKGSDFYFTWPKY